MAEIFCVDPKNIATYWDTVEPFLAEAMEYSNFETAGDLRTALDAGTAALWIIHTGPKVDAAIVTQQKIDKHGKFHTIWALGGRDLEDWIHFHSEFTAFAEREGCNRMIHELRPGFARVMMKKFGYRMTHCTIEKVV